MELKMSELIRKRKAIDKARVEYHSFMSVRTLEDISSSYDLTKTRMRLEGNLVSATNEFNKLVESIK